MARRSRLLRRVVLRAREPGERTPCTLRTDAQLFASMARDAPFPRRTSPLHYARASCPTLCIARVHLALIAHGDAPVMARYGHI